MELTSTNHGSVIPLPLPDPPEWMIYEERRRWRLANNPTAYKLDELWPGGPTDYLCHHCRLRIIEQTHWQFDCPVGKAEAIDEHALYRAALARWLEQEAAD